MYPSCQDEVSGHFDLLLHCGLVTHNLMAYSKVLPGMLPCLVQGHTELSMKAAAASERTMALSRV